METRASAVNGVIGIVLDPHILSRAREERDVALERCTKHRRAIATLVVRVHSSYGWTSYR
jgi:hypothetical protein